MAGNPLQSRADGLAARVEALARALEASGVGEEASARILSRASAAVLQALTLELLLDEPPATAAPRRATSAEHRPELDLRLAA